MVASLRSASLPAWRPQLAELPYTEFIKRLGYAWQQGEHVALLGPTGSGKTWVAKDVCSLRDYCVVLAVKPQDDTLRTFAHLDPPYKITKKWPLDYNVPRAVLKITPKSLNDTTQASRVYKVLDDIFNAGGYCLLIDDTGYVTGILRLKRQVTQLLNVGRSSGLSLVTAATQPTSVAANIPSETLRQVRHILLWRFEDLRDIDACRMITGLPKQVIADAMAALNVYPDSSTDFLYYRRGRGMLLVRQDR